MKIASAPYAKLDRAINRWVEKHDLVLQREWQGEARFWYTSRGTECFQISVDRPVGHVVTVNANSIETDDDAELHARWRVSSVALEATLSTATKLVDLWASRARAAG
jgi:hypothetical protein